jgi:hypothetical protein
MREPRRPGAAPRSRGAGLRPIDLNDTLYHQLTLLLRAADEDVTAEILDRAANAGNEAVALTVDDRQRILAALDDLPEGLADLRAVLLNEDTWRVREGLVQR